jgi:transcriptional regulator with GAF, ATPase, and Fis domain
VNCAALAGGLIESELFGHEKGAFTGAQLNRAGRFELADGTTLFLDEIGDLPLELQPKLLRVLQEGEFERVGGSTTIKTDVRIVAATNRDLEKEVEEGRFRKDLWYRLNVFPIYVPSLRERLQDIPLFVSFFLKRYGTWMGKEFYPADEKTIRALQAYSWPGNIRELENLIERAVITSSPGALRIDVPRERVALKSGKGTMEEMERSYITEVLNATYWRVNGPSGAAARLGMNPSTLRFRMKALGISRPGSAQG